MGCTVVFVVLVALKIVISETLIGSCPNLPDGCQCAHPKQRDKVICKNDEWTTFKNLDFSKVPLNTSTLILSKNRITKLEKDFSLFLPWNITKLDLSSNKISDIEDNAFFNLTNLEKLDLSNNYINTISLQAFKGLVSLTKLNLLGNPLICDCHLSWIIDWAQEKKVKIQKSTCQFPAQRKGVSLARIHKEDMHCDWPLQLPIFEMSPSSNQLVFEGDSMFLQCNASNIDKDIQVTWVLDGQLLPSSEFPSPEFISTANNHSGLLVSNLQISQLKLNHSGMWLCHVSTSRGNLSRSVKLVVISKMAPYCPEIITWGNKGKYHWPQTLAGVVTDVACSGPPPKNLGQNYQPARAFHTCNWKGQWEALDLSSCPFISEVTVVLEQFSKANLTQGKTVVETARGLRNYTGNGTMLTDVMDLVFITQTLEEYLKFVTQNKELSEILLDVINSVMNVDSGLLKEAQIEDGICNRLTRIVDSLSEALADSAESRHNNNIIIEQFLLKSEGFPGIRCSSFKNQPQKMMLKRNFHCVMANSTLLHRPEETVETSIYIPPRVFNSLSSTQDQISQPPWGHTNKLQFTLYQSSALFPNQWYNKAKQVTSPVISCKAAHLPLAILSKPVEVTLQVPAYTPDIQPVYWNHSSHDGKGDWSPVGCKIEYVYGSTVTFSCPFLGTFGIIQDIQAMLVQKRYQQAQFRLLHPAIYSGSVFILACLIISMGLYFKQWSYLRMSKNNKHSLFNTWLSLSLLVCVFTLGVPQTDFPQLCQAVGLVLHYLTLCTLIWMVITINNLYKSLSHREQAEDCTQDEDEEPRDPSVPPKPILRFYLVGWGVATIICGISAAVQLDHYAGQHFCFLSQSSSLAALYGPVGILLLLLLIYLLLIRCFLSPESELSGLPLVAANGSTPSADAHSILDEDFSSSTLLRFHTVILIFFLLTWVSAAIAICRPFVLLNDLIFSIVYCFFSIMLGLFVFSFFCYSRHDIRKCLSGTFGKDAEGTGIEQPINPIEFNAPVGDCTLDEPESQQRAENDVVVVRDKIVEKAPNVNLLVNHNPPAELIVVSSNMDLFYNPRQSIVARKFFEKNRRQQQIKMLHKNNLEKEAATNGSNTSGRARAYSDTEHATSVASGDRSFLCTSQSYGGPSSHHQSELKALVQNPNLSKVAIPMTAPSSSNVHTFVASKENCGLPPWMVGAPSCARSSCSECSNCTKAPLSIYSYSDITSVSQRADRRRPRSRNYGKCYKAHQYSWDDKCSDGRTKVFAQEGAATTGHPHRKHRRKVGSRNSVHLSPTPEKASSKNAFARSQSASEQIYKHRVMLNESRELHSQDHLETRM